MTEGFFSLSAAEPQSTIDSPNPKSVSGFEKGRVSWATTASHVRASASPTQPGDSNLAIHKPLSLWSRPHPSPC
ncbi:hypothetical protein BO78DRAFT_176891 [Aspergillus sclerotiicarbonarius CBS 121057]|uniref:Uncharacterized protein n=1 Tax=Aspergillus sclerotiicarbonarius (strain CBS 121057 / IBT 28362) TaxID=1448318 RepID=A0A319E7L8_ASPSB|nr:hypothetical protein BO78DRAFT_176891 [Aspergillus sclerotiicarbonarius CBS 121057]